jgi:hypothetical protein
LGAGHSFASPNQKDKDARKWPDPFRRKRFWVACLAVSLVIVALTEFLLRTVLGLGTPILYAADPRCGYLARPNQHVRRFFVRIDINSKGMRSPELPPLKPKGTLRLMFLGDSLIFGTTQVDQSQILTELLRRELPVEVHHPVEELNASANAWAISNEYGFLKSRGTFGTDYVLLVLNSSDLSQPFSTLRDLGDDVSTERPSAIGELFTKFIAPRLKIFRNKWDAGTSTQDDPIIERQNVNLLNDLHSYVRSKSAKLLVLFIPFRQMVTSSAQNSAPPELQSWAAKHNVPLLDLTAAVSEYPTDEITVGDRFHYNSKGNRLLAAAIDIRLVDVLERNSGGG